MNNNYSQWIGRRSPVPWLPRPPDHNPLDFYFRGYMKDFVYVQVSDTREHIQQAAEQLQGNRSEIKTVTSSIGIRAHSSKRKAF